MCCGRCRHGLCAGLGPVAARRRARRGGRGKQRRLSSSRAMVLRGRGALPWPGPAASCRVGWRRTRDSIVVALGDPGPCTQNDSSCSPQRSSRATAAAPAWPLVAARAGGRMTGEAPCPWLGLRFLSRMLPGPTTRYGDSGTPASAFRQGVSRLTTARATTSASLRMHNGTPHPGAGGMIAMATEPP